MAFWCFYPKRLSFLGRQGCGSRACCRYPRFGVRRQMPFSGVFRQLCGHTCTSITALCNLPKHVLCPCVVGKQNWLRFFVLLLLRSHLWLQAVHTTLPLLHTSPGRGDIRCFFSHLSFSAFTRCCAYDTLPVSRTTLFCFLFRLTPFHRPSSVQFVRPLAFKAAISAVSSAVHPWHNFTRYHAPSLLKPALQANHNL